MVDYSDKLSGAALWSAVTGGLVFLIGIVTALAGAAIVLFVLFDIATGGRVTDTMTGVHVVALLFGLSGVWAGRGLIRIAIRRINATCSGIYSIIFSAYMTRFRLGRIQFFLLMLPIASLSIIIDRGAHSDDIKNSWVAGLIAVVLLVLTALSISLRRNRLLDLNWSPIRQHLATWSPAALWLAGLFIDGPDFWERASAPVAFLVGATILVERITGIALIFSRGTKLQAPNSTIVDPKNRRNLVLGSLLQPKGS